MNIAVMPSTGTNLACKCLIELNTAVIRPNFPQNSVGFPRPTLPRYGNRFVCKVDVRIVSASSHTWSLLLVNWSNNCDRKLLWQLFAKCSSLSEITVIQCERACQDPGIFRVRSSLGAAFEDFWWQTCVENFYKEDVRRKYNNYHSRNVRTQSSNLMRSILALS